jgi:hypothetical protein
LPDVVAAPGPITLASPMKAIADAIVDPAIERVSVLKSARIGLSTVLTATNVLADPCPVLVLLPTEDDCRDTECGMHDGNDKLRVSGGVPLAEDAVDLVTRKLQAASTHRLRFRHWIFPPGEVMDRPRARRRGGGPVARHALLAT